MVLLGFSNIAKHIKIGADPILVSAFANHARYIYVLNIFPIGEADKALDRGCIEMEGLNLLLVEIV